MQASKKLTSMHGVHTNQISKLENQAKEHIVGSFAVKNNKTQQNNEEFKYTCVNLR